jgi:NAD(P)-dependent dehydrogenase (short-subunit alcohol dehydrogenase family)
MSYWRGKTVVITGAASGIGKGLALELARREARIVATDIDLDALRATAKACGQGAEAIALDVCDAAQVMSCCEEIAKRHGRIDILFNNAGIGIYGEVHEIPLESWNRIIDINIRGVIHGIRAVYPLMVKQGSGHIINTASLAGLGAVPLFTPYAMTKHAIVGLTKSLRLEAETFGVRISALCPSAIDTPLLDRTENPGLPKMNWRPYVRRFLTKLGGPPYPTERFVQEALEAIEENQDIIVLPQRARIGHRLGIFLPSLVAKVTRKALATEREDRDARS